MSNSKKEHILVVDDNPDNLRLIISILKDKNYSIRPAKDGQTAIKSAVSNPPDLVLMDILMPGINGYEACRQIKANPKTLDIPVIFISAMDATIDKVQAFSAGGVDYISKPFNEDELLARINTHLSLQKARKKLAEKNRLLHHEIAERKLVEKSLKEQRDLAQNYLETAEVMLLVLNLDGTVRTINAKGCRILGYKKDEIVGTNWFENYLREKEKISTCEIFKSLTKGVPDRFSCFEQHIVNRDGEERLIAWHNTITRSDTGEITGTLSSGQDITERRKTEQALRKAKEEAEVANKAKSTFLANMSHELRTPLNGILGFTQILKNDSKATPRQVKGLNVIEQSGNHLLNLLNDILDLAKIESGKIDLNETEFDLSDMLEEISGIIKIRAKQKDIEFSLEKQGSISAIVKTDDKLLRQVLLNLLGNAVKFTDTGKVTLKISEKGKIKQDPISKTIFRFQVKDTGIGISREDLKDIFKPFHQAGDIEKKAEGTGLGLAISRKLLNLMGAALKAESRPGSGSVFRFDLQLPVIETQNDLEKSKTGKNKIIGYSKKNKIKLLIVDDSMVNRIVFTHMLKPLGFEICDSDNAADALEKAESFKPDAIITDLVMPKTDGFELIKQVRKHPVLKNTPIIASSASVYKEDYIKSINAGADDFLSKPVKKEPLFNILEKLLDIEWKYENLPKTGSANKTRQNKIEIPEPAKKRLPELLNILENELLPEYQEIRDVFFIEDISDFALKTINIAKEFNIAFLSDYGAQLHDCAQKFMVEDIEYLLSQFMEIVHKIKSINSSFKKEKISD